MRNKKGNVFAWIIVLILVSFIVVAITVPSVREKISSNSESNNKTEDALIVQCQDSYNICRDITIKKYSISVWLNEIKKFNNTLEARDFYDTWTDNSYPRSLEFDLTRDYSPRDGFNDYPIVLIAVGRNGIAGGAPVVLICDKEGNLLQKSKDYMGC